MATLQQRLACRHPQELACAACGKTIVRTPSEVAWAVRMRQGLYCDNSCKEKARAIERAKMKASLILATPIMTADRFEQPNCDLCGLPLRGHARCVNCTILIGVKHFERTVTEYGTCGDLICISSVRGGNLMKGVKALQAPLTFPARPIYQGDLG